MRIVACYSTERDRVAVTRGLDDDRRWLQVSVPWSHLRDPAATLQAVAGQLTAEEMSELRGALLGPNGRWPS